MCSSSFSVNIPPPDSWAKDCITMMYQAESNDEFGVAFDEFVARDALIIVDGAKMTREQYKMLLLGQRGPGGAATVEFTGVVQTKAMRTADIEGAGVVGIFFTATISQKAFIHGAPTSRTITSSLNISVVPEKTLVPPEDGAPDCYRRAKALDQVFMVESGTTLAPNA